TYLQIAPTSRSEVPEYETLSRAVNETLGRINGSLGEPGWVPIQYVTSSYPRPLLAALYRLARVALVTPLRDGMNLVAKEYVAAQDPLDPGVLILSRFAGAARQMTEALLINPNSPEEIADALKRALTMEKPERIRRWRTLFDNVQREDVTAWRDAFVGALAGAQENRPALAL